MEALDRGAAAIERLIWETRKEDLDRPRAVLLTLVRYACVVGRTVRERQLTLRAMSLVYTTLLSLVPLLAVSFSVLKAFGVHNRIEPLLYRFLAPLGPKAGEITDRVVEFVSRVNAGVLGSLGLVMFVYTVISLLQKVETTFNELWRVQAPRSFARRFSDYMSVILVGPVLVFAALGLTASVMSAEFIQSLLAFEPLGRVVRFLARLLPYLMVSGAFTFLYSFLPNRKVKLSSALVGGVVAGVLWETAGWGFAAFIVTSTKYTAIYSGFAILIFFMIWLYVSWLILIVGAVISFYHQHPRYVARKRPKDLLNTRLLERASLLVMFLVALRFARDRDPWSMDELVDETGLPIEAVQAVVETLEHRRLLQRTGEDLDALLPGRSLDTIALTDILEALRPEGGGEEQGVAVREVQHVMKGLDRAVRSALGKETLRDMVLAYKGETLPGDEKAPPSGEGT
ncbi:MAG: YihY/virulence factor BrkB family protein [Nitrospirota bacterium]